MQLLVYRLLAGILIAVVLNFWMYASAPFQLLILYTGAAFVSLLIVQGVLFFKGANERLLLIFQFTGDVLLVSALILATGGVGSPFSLLLGLIIISAGSCARFVLPMAISLLACAGYLTAVYAGFWMQHHGWPDAARGLHILLQVSALMLVGGIMAAIARRHARLSASSERVILQHRKLRDLHDKLMESMCEGVIVLDQQLELSDMNEAATRFLGGRPVSDLTSIAAVHDCLHSAFKPSCQCEYTCGEKTLLVAVTALTDDLDAAWLLTLVDISTMRSMERQLHQQEKMAALGGMASMLAHEIRNPIHTIAQGLEMLPVREVKGVNIRDILHEEVLRLNRLVTTMLNYAQPLQPNPDCCYMPSVMKSAVNQLEVSVKRQVKTRCKLDMLLLDSDHFRLVLDNLLANAAANSAQDSAITIALERKSDEWCLQVSNKGFISESVANNLFEPFVSGQSCGVGLGLATVKQVCSINGWHVDVASHDDQVCFLVQGLIVLPDDENGEQWEVSNG